MDGPTEVQGTGDGMRLPVARSVAGFHLAPNEEVVVDLSPTRHDALVNGVGTGGLLWLMFVVTHIVGLGGEEPGNLAQFGILTVFMAAIGALVALFSTAHRTRLLATDRGVHVRRGDGRDPEFVPWADIVSIEPAG